MNERIDMQNAWKDKLKDVASTFISTEQTTTTLLSLQAISRYTY